MPNAVDFSWFNPDEHGTAMRLEPGKYKVMVSGAEVKTTKSGTGSALCLTYTVVDGQKRGSLAVEYINYRNASDTAQKIGLDQLGDFYRAIGIQRAQSNLDFLNKILLITTNIETNDGREYVRVVKKEPFVSAVANFTPDAAPAASDNVSDDVPF